MSPRVLTAGDLILWFHSFDALHEDRASVHVGKGSQNDYTDAKIWLEPTIEVARSGEDALYQFQQRGVELDQEDQDK